MSRKDDGLSSFQRTQQLAFKIDYSFPVYFTVDLFAPDNPAFFEAVTRLEPSQRHKMLLVIDHAVTTACPELIGNIEKYFEVHRDSIELLGAPLLTTGGEASKNDFAPILGLLSAMNARGIDRHSFIAVIGGGAVLDMACFAAAVAHRGVRAIRIPTTVLSQCDSGVGVKNAINLFGKKNFIGTFAPPFAVLNDFRFVETLEHRDKIAGIAEAVKVALIRDRAFYEFLEGNVKRLARAELDALIGPIRRSAQLHMEHIRTSGDPFELGSARPLDFGHWSAHRLESMTANRLRHGEAVAIGMALDLVYSVRRGYLRPDCAERILTLLETLGLALWDEALLRQDQNGTYLVLAGLREFREHLGGSLHITLIRDIGRSFEVQEMDETIILDSIHWLQRRAENRRAVGSRSSPALDQEKAV
ncbi:MAG: 3-dehydroquinate synthase [Acidobacteriota bacterium]